MTNYGYSEDLHEDVPDEMMCEYWTDVEGAPFRIGQWVQFVGRTDKTISTEGLGRVGRVKRLDYGLECGQTYPADPGIVVEGLPHDWYWHDELRALTDEEITKVTKTNVLVPEQVMRPQIEYWTESFWEIAPESPKTEP